jgi:acyl-CoA thioester hydrolase
VKLRVRYAETDQMRIAHHSAYLIWFEAARVEWLRARGLDYRTLEAAGISLAVSAIEVLYHRSSRFDDELEIDASLTELRSRRVRYRYIISREGDLIATGSSQHTPIDASGRVVRLPPMWLEALRAHLVSS